MIIYDIMIVAWFMMEDSIGITIIVSGCTLMDIKHHYACPLLELKGRGSCSSSILSLTPLTRGYLSQTRYAIPLLSSNITSSVFPKFTQFMLYTPPKIHCLVSTHKLSQGLDTWMYPLAVYVAQITLISLVTSMSFAWLKLFYMHNSPCIYHMEI